MSTNPPLTILLVGGTRSIGRHAAAAATRAGHRIRILNRASGDSSTDIVTGDLTDPTTLVAAVAGLDALIFTHGTHGGEPGVRDVDYGGVRNVLTAISDRPVRIALMTAIGVTVRDGSYNRSTKAHDWKRRAGRLVRASGHPYAIVRPGWFDYNDPDQHHLRFLQGDPRRAGNPSDGVFAPSQIAEVLVGSLTCPVAARKHSSWWPSAVPLRMISNRCSPPSPRTRIWMAPLTRAINRQRPNLRRSAVICSVSQGSRSDDQR